MMPDSSTNFETGVLYKKIAAYMETGKAAGLEVEVIGTALLYVQELPQRYEKDIALALHDAMRDWDII